MAIYMSMKGQKQGDFKGGATASGFSGKIMVLSAQLGLGHGVDANTALATGRQVIRPLIVTKRLDVSSPLILTASNNNENITTVLITYVMEGSSQAQTATVELTNANIQDVEQVMHGDGTSVETLKIGYQKCEFTWVAGGIVSNWDVSASA